MKHLWIAPVAAVFVAFAFVGCQQTTPMDEPPTTIDLEITRLVQFNLDGREVIAQRFSVPQLTAETIPTVSAQMNIGSGDAWFDLPYSAHETCYFPTGQAVCSVTFALLYEPGSATFFAVGIVPATSDTLDVEGFRVRLFFAQP